MVYVLDTNILIEFEKRYYPEIFPSFWKKLHSLIESEEVISLKESQAELKENSKARKFWDKVHYESNKKFFIELEENETRYMDRIFNLDIANKKFKVKGNNTTLQKEWGEYSVAVADPLIICHGLHHGSTVVTDESPNKGYNIPHVCRELNVKCVGLKDFLSINGFKF